MVILHIDITITHDNQNTTQKERRLSKASLTVRSTVTYPLTTVFNKISIDSLCYRPYKYISIGKRSNFNNVRSDSSLYPLDLSIYERAYQWVIL